MEPCDRDEIGMELYIIGAAMVFGIVLSTFLKDASTPKTHVNSWLVVVGVTIAWFVVLPSLIRKRLQRSEALNPNYLKNRLN
jgi:predicted MFS family arabinose efflux permease